MQGQAATGSALMAVTPPRGLSRLLLPPSYPTPVGDVLPAQKQQSRPVCPSERTSGLGLAPQTDQGSSSSPQHFPGMPQSFLQALVSFSVWWGIS